MASALRFSRLRPWLLSAVIASAVCLSAPTAHADASAEATAKAAQLKDQGNAAMDAFHYKEALGFYDDAYKLTQDPALLFNKGRALEALGDFPAALAAQEEFNAKAAPELKAKVPGLDKLIADLRGRVAVIELHVNVEGGEVRLGDRVLGNTSEKSFSVNAGNGLLKITKEGYFPYERDMALAGGRTTVLDVKLESKSTRGILVVRSPISGALVQIDGVGFGMVPTETPVSPGAHRLHLTHDGYVPGDTTTTVAAGQRREVDVPLDATTPIYKRWWFWTGIGLVVAGGVVLTYALVTERSPDKGTIDPGQVSTTAIRF